MTRRHSVIRVGLVLALAAWLVFAWTSLGMAVGSAP